MKKILSVLSVAAFAACGGSNPKIYVLVVNTSSLLPGTLPTSCSPPVTAPDIQETATATESNEEVHIQIWQSSDGKTTILSATELDVSNIFAPALTLFTGGSGTSALPHELTELSSTDGKTFTDTFTDKGGTTDTTIQDTFTITFTFADTSYTKGTLTISAGEVCSGTCVAADTFTCSPAAMSFVGTQITGDNEVIYEAPTSGNSN